MIAYLRALKDCAYQTVDDTVDDVRGRGAIPSGLREAVSILSGEVPTDAPLQDSASGEYRRKKDTRKRLILRELHKAVPIDPRKVQGLSSEAFRKVLDRRPKLFESAIPAPSRSAKRNERQLYEKAGQRLNDWLGAWIRCGQSGALLMYARPDIEQSLNRWWSQPKQFLWPELPNGSAPVMASQRRPSAEAIACRALWVILNHPERSRFLICEGCEEVFYAASLRKVRRYCNACRARNPNKLKPYMVNAEMRKLKAARCLLNKAQGENWKAKLLAQPEARAVDLSSNWLNRRIKERKLSLPDGV